MKFLTFALKMLLWLFCITVAGISLFFLYNLNYFLNRIFYDQFILNGIQVLIIAFLLKVIFMKLYMKIFKKKLDYLKKDGIKKGRILKGEFMKTKKCHIVNLVADTFLVLILMLVSLSEILDLTVITEMLENFKVGKLETIASISGVLVLTLVLQYKTTLSNPKKETKQSDIGESKCSEEIYKELICFLKEEK